jgi:plasmid maintenance system antidote protein VapI
MGEYAYPGSDYPLWRRIVANLLGVTLPRRTISRELGEKVIAQRNYAVAPGEYVTEWLEENNITLSQLAFDLGVSESYATDLIGGKMPISPTVAISLSDLTGIPVKRWTALDTMYWSDRERIARTEAIENDRAKRRAELLGETIEADK